MIFCTFGARREHHQADSVQVLASHQPDRDVGTMAGRLQALKKSPNGLVAVFACICGDCVPSLALYRISTAQQKSEGFASLSRTGRPFDTEVFRVDRFSTPGRQQLKLACARYRAFPGTPTN